MQQCYEREIAMAKNEGKVDWFRKMRSVTWPASTTTFVLPDGLHQKSLLYLWDITNNDPGVQLIVGGGPESSATIFWQDNKTLQWLSSGPSTDTTIRAFYIADAEKIQPATSADDAEYELLPPEHQWLLVWSTAVLLREAADESAPQAWYSNLDTCRRAFWKHTSRAKLWSDWGGGGNPYTAQDNQEI
jgi:hypothetical protein